MATRSVELTEDDEAFLDGLVAAGRFPDVGAALGEGLRLVVKDEAEIAAFVERITEAHRGMQRGEFPPGMDEATTRRAFRMIRLEWEEWESMFAPSDPT